MSYNNLFKKPQLLKAKQICGRSMIEMLGVLAIIGVLSAGGIMGYSTAMENHKINQYIEDINFIVANAMLIAAAPPKEVSLITSNDEDGREALKSLNILPSHYNKLTSEGYLESPFGTRFSVGLDSKLTNGGGSGDYANVILYAPRTHIFVDTYELPKRICMKLLIHDWTGNSSILTHVRRAGSALAQTLVDTPHTVEEAEESCLDEGNQVNMSFFLQGSVAFTD